MTNDLQPAGATREMQDEGRKTKDEGRRTKDEGNKGTIHRTRRSFIVHRSSFIVHRSSLVVGRRSLVGGRWSLVGLVVLAVSILVACGAAPGEPSLRAEQTGLGGVNPEAVAQSFFEDLHTALKDPKLSGDETRSYWVERLSGYFAPNERDDQREILGTALDSFAAGLSQLNPDQTLTLELRFDGVEKLSSSGDRALVRPVNASVYLLIAHTTDRGPVTDYDQTIGLDKIIGRADGAIPVVKIGDRWFLTEG